MSLQSESFWQTSIASAIFSYVSEVISMNCRKIEEPADIYTTPTLKKRKEKQVHMSSLKFTGTDKWSKGLKRWEAILIIPLKMQRVFVNINFPGPKGAS